MCTSSPPALRQESCLQKICRQEPEEREVVARPSFPSSLTSSVGPLLTLSSFVRLCKCCMLATLNRGGLLLQSRPRLVPVRRLCSMSSDQFQGPGSQELREKSCQGLCGKCEWSSASKQPQPDMLSFPSCTFKQGAQAAASKG